MKIKIHFFILIILFINQINCATSTLEQGLIVNHTGENINLTVNIKGADSLEKVIGKNSDDNTHIMFENFNKITSLSAAKFPDDKSQLISGCSKRLSKNKISTEKYDFLTGVLYTDDPNDTIEIIKNKNAFEAVCAVKPGAVPLSEQGKIVNDTGSAMTIQINYKDLESKTNKILVDGEIMPITSNWTKITGINIIDPKTHEVKLINSCHKDLSKSGETLDNISPGIYSFSDRTATQTTEDTIRFIKNKNNLIEAVCTIKEGAAPIK